MPGRWCWTFKQDNGLSTSQCACLHCMTLIIAGRRLGQIAQWLASPPQTGNVIWVMSSGTNHCLQCDTARCSRVLEFPREAPVVLGRCSKNTLGILFTFCFFSSTRILDWSDCHLRRRSSNSITGEDLKTVSALIPLCSCAAYFYRETSASLSNKMHLSDEIQLPDKYS